MKSFRQKPRSYNEDKNPGWFRVAWRVELGSSQKSRGKTGRRRTLLALYGLAGATDWLQERSLGYSALCYRSSISRLPERNGWDLMPKGSAVKEEPIQDVGLAGRRLFTTFFRGRCPNCGEGRITRGFFNIENRCNVCRAEFERGDAGNWLVAATLNYFFTAALCILVTVFLVRTYGFFDGVTFMIAGLALILGALLYRPAKLLGVWIL